jgi:hypothetical protein
LEVVLQTKKPWNKTLQKCPHLHLLAMLTFYNSESNIQISAAAQMTSSPRKNDSILFAIS